MKVLIAGGLRVDSIITSLKQKYPIGLDALGVQSIEDIHDTYLKGEYFDRIILCEQCWTDSSQLNNEDILRKRLYDFTLQLNNINSKKNTEYIFLTKTDDKAMLVSEETVLLKGSITIIVKDGPIKAKFFSDLSKNDISTFSDSIKFNSEQSEFDGLDGIAEFTDTDDESVYDTEFEPDMSKLIAQFDDGDDSDWGFSTEGFSGTIQDDEGLSDSIESNTDEELNDDNASDDEFVGDNFSDEGFNSEGFDGITSFESFESFNNDTETEQSDEEDLSELFNTNISNNTAFNGNSPMEEDDMDGGGLFFEPEAIHINPSEPTNPGKIFGDTEYERLDNVVEHVEPRNAKIELTDAQIKSTLDAFANRGNSILITGCGNCGASTVAFNLANTISNIGYSVLLIDLDTVGKTQSYISKDSYDCVNSDPSSAAIRAAINSTTGVTSHVAIVRPGFHLLTMGMESDSVELETILDPSKFNRFINMVKSAYQFIVYDVQFKDVIGCAKDLTYSADNLVIALDSSNKGVTKTILSMCNIDSEDVREVMFSKGQLLFNRFKGFPLMLGKRVKSAMDVVKIMDSKINELTGDDVGHLFQDMHICGVINEDNEFENGWYTANQYTDKETGMLIFTDLLKNIVLNI